MLDALCTFCQVSSNFSTPSATFFRHRSISAGVGERICLEWTVEKSHRQGPAYIVKYLVFLPRIGISRVFSTTVFLVLPWSFLAPAMSYSRWWIMGSLILLNLAQPKPKVPPDLKWNLFFHRLHCLVFKMAVGWAGSLEGLVMRSSFQSYCPQFSPVVERIDKSLALPLFLATTGPTQWWTSTPNLLKICAAIFIW